MKKTLLALCFATFTCNMAQNPTYQWGNTDQYSPMPDQSGNFYSSITMSGTMDVDPGPGVYTINPMGATGLVRKIDVNGNLVWAKNFGGGAGFNLISGTTDQAGNIIACGLFYNTTVDFDPGPGTYTLTAYFQDVFICKFSPIGNLVWAKSFEGALGNEDVVAVSCDSQNNILLTGIVKETTDFDPGPGVYTLTPTGVSNTDRTYICKLSSNGNFVWAGLLHDQGTVSSRSIKCDKNKNVYVCGQYNGSIDFDSSPASSIKNTSTSDGFILKLDSNGVFVWVKTLDGIPSSGSIVRSIAVDVNGSVSACGDFWGTVDFDPSVNTNSAATTGSLVDCFAIKLNAGGNLLWKNTFGNVDRDHANALAIDQLGSVYITGSFENIVDFDPGAGVNNLTPFGADDVYILKLDANGNFLWARNFGGGSAPLSPNFPYDEGISIYVDQYNNIYSNGNLRGDGGNGDFDPGPSVDSYSASLGSIVKYTHKMNDCSAPAAPSNITPSQNLNVCIAGSASISVSSIGNVKWFTSPTATNVVGTGTTFITPTLSAGSYTYYAEANTCTTSIARTAITVTASICSGLMEVNENLKLSIAPNPFTEKITLNLPVDSKIIICDLTSKIVYETYLNAGSNELQLNEINTGVYILNAIYTNGKTTAKLIKQ